MDDMLLEIKNAENKAKNIVDEAARNKSAIIKKAEEEVKKMEADEIDKYIGDMEKKIAKETEEIKKEGILIVEEGKRKASRILKKSESNSDNAISFLSKKFLEMTE